jgi:hypothetical protein
MIFSGATAAGDAATENEDWAAATSDLVVMLDGATVRTETGCRHGAAWYTRKLGASIIAAAAVRSHPLTDVLADAIRDVAELHPECDLAHPGTPSAAAAIVRLDGDQLRYAVLGDVTLAVETADGVQSISDQRVTQTAAAERAVADSYPIGSPEKRAALLDMKVAELAARNTPGGYWVAAADPSVVTEAITGTVPIGEVRRLAVLTDGAARYVDLFGARRLSWAGALDVMARSGPRAVIEQLRTMETRDPDGVRYRRNKRHDDATVVFATATEITAPYELPRNAQRSRAAGSDILAMLNSPHIMGEARR